MPKKVIVVQHIRRNSIFALLISVVCWGAALPIVKPALDTTSPFLFLFYRFVFAAIFSFPILIHYWPKVDRKHHAIFKIIISESIGTVLGLSLLYAGLERTSAIEASLIATTTPIFITIGAVLFLKEKMERHEILGLFVAFIGTIILTAEPLLSGRSLQLSGSMGGNLLVFAQNIVTAVYFLVAKKHYKGIPKLFVTSISFYIGLVAFFIIDWVIANHSISTFTQMVRNDLSMPSVYWAVLYMAIFGSIVGLTAYFRGQDGIEASEASIFTYLHPLVFIPLSVLWLKESISMTAMVAVVLIGIGVVLAEVRTQRKKKMKLK